MKLTNLFENKKELKDRNPVAKELRQNPLYKAKTEIDKKKESKKGYEKHKGKVEEADPDTLGKMNTKMRDVLSKVDSDDKAQTQADQNKAEHERLAKVKELGDAGMQDYIQKLKSHDWTYEYSDDHSVWQRGSSERSEIRRLSAILDPKREIWNKYDPFAKKTEASGYEGQVEPHKHIFKTIDYSKIKQAIDDKNLKAFAEKLPDGSVAVHTMNPSRKELVKVMGVTETLEEGIFGKDSSTVKQSDPLKVIGNLAMRKDNNPFPIKTRDGSIEVTPSQAQKFINKFYRASQFTRDEYLDRLKTMQTAKKVFEDEATSQRYAAAWRKEHPIGSNWLNPDDYDADAEGIHYITNTRTEMDIFKVPAKNYDEAFDKWLDGGSTSNPKDNMYYDSTKDYASDHSYWGRKETEQDDELEDSVQKEDNNELRTMANSMDTVERTYGDIMQGVRGRGPADESEVGDYIPKGMTKDQILKLIDMLEPQGYNKDFLLTDLADLMKEGVLDDLWGASKQAIRDPNVDWDKVERDSDFVYALRDAGYSDKQIRMAYGVLNDPRYKQGNYSGAVAVINKIAPGLANHPSVKNALMRANENTNVFNSEYDEVLQILKSFPDEYQSAKQDGIEYGSELYSKLFDYFSTSGEMPYGTMKARDGMPDEWIQSRLEDLGLLESEVNNLLNRSNRNRDNEIVRLSQLAGIVPKDIPMEDYSQMTHDLITKLINDGKSNEEIQARTGETGKRIEIIRKHIEDKETVEATQDLAQKLNPFKSAVDTQVSPQITAKGLDAISKGERPTPNQIKAVEPYVSKLAKAISNPQTSAQMRNVFKKVQ